MRGLRRQYLDVVGQRLAAGNLAGVLDLGWRWLGSALARRSGRALVGPALGTALVTYRCDLRCRVCDLPARAAARRRAGEQELGTRAWLDVLRDFKAIGTAGIGFTGGEPMLREDLPVLLRAATRLGMHAHLNTDGLWVAERARELLATGLRSVNISLDGSDAATHDAARGRPGAFKAAVDGLQALRRARPARGGPRLTAVTVLTAHNLGQLGAVVEAALAAGADRVGVLPVHDFGQGEPATQAGEVAGAIALLRARHGDGVIDNSLAYLDLIPRALRGEPSPLACYAPWTSVVVDCYGEVYPCFPFMERKQAVGRLPLARLWRSEAYAAQRARLAGCRDCLWNCHAEMSLALPQPAVRSGASA